MERLNQDTSFSPTELNHLLNAMSTLPSTTSYPMVTPAVTKPRQLAPTVGLVSKGVIITGEAQRGMKNLIISKVTASQYEDDRPGYSVKRKRENYMPGKSRPREADTLEN